MRVEVRRIFLAVLIVQFFSLSVEAAPHSASLFDRLCYSVIGVIGTRDSSVKIFTHDWEQLPAVEVLKRGYVGRSVVLRTNDQYKLYGVVGRLESLEIREGLAMASILDRRGQRNIVALSEGEMVFIVIPKNASDFYINYLDKAMSPNFPRIDTKQVEDLRQAQVIGEREFWRLEQAAKDSMDYMKLGVLMNFYHRLARLSTRAIPWTVAFWVGTSLVRYFTLYPTDLWLLHLDTLASGVVGLSLVHSWSSFYWPESRTQFLAYTSLGYLGIKLFETVSFGLARFSPYTYYRLRSDWPDFTTALVAVGLYTAAVKTAEKYVEFKMLRRYPTEKDIRTSMVQELPP